MALGYVVDNLANRPAAGSVRRLQLPISRTANDRAQIGWHTLEIVDECSARRGIQRNRWTMKFSDRKLAVHGDVCFPPDRLGRRSSPAIGERRWQGRAYAVSL